MVQCISSGVAAHAELSMNSVWSKPVRLHAFLVFGVFLSFMIFFLFLWFLVVFRGLLICLSSTLFPTQEWFLIYFSGKSIGLKQWFPNCGTPTTGGTRRPSRWYARPFCSSTQKEYILFSLIGFC